MGELTWPDIQILALPLCFTKAGLSAHFKVDCAFRREGSEKDYICYAGIITEYIKSQKKNCRAPLLADNPSLADFYLNLINMVLRTI